MARIYLFLCAHFITPYILTSQIVVNATLGDLTCHTGALLDVNEHLQRHLCCSIIVKAKKPWGGSDLRLSKSVLSICNFWHSTHLC